MTCQHCGQDAEHTGVCHKIKAIEYFENGKVKRVEYVTAADFQAALGAVVPHGGPIPWGACNPPPARCDVIGQASSLIWGAAP